MQGLYRTNYIALKKIMIDREIGSIQELSERSQVNRNTLAKILSGKIRPSADAMEKLVHTLNISPEDAGRIFFSEENQGNTG